MSTTSLSVRLGIATSFGLALAFIVLLWITQGDGPFILWITQGDGPFILKLGQKVTRKRIQQATVALNEWKREHKKYPAPFSVDARYLVGVDGWRRPFHYSLINGVPLIESLGRDGVCGGVGLDCDISNRNLHPANERMPRLQQITHPAMRRVVFVALLCGVLAGSLVFWSLQNGATRPESRLGLAISLSVSFVMAAYGALVIAASHIPSGH